MQIPAQIRPGSFATRATGSTAIAMLLGLAGTGAAQAGDSREQAMQKTWVVDMRGRPPFDRQRAEVRVVDAASMQIESPADSGTVFRERPPFKRHK